MCIHGFIGNVQGDSLHEVELQNAKRVKEHGGSQVDTIVGVRTLYVVVRMWSMSFERLRGRVRYMQHLKQ